MLCYPAHPYPNRSVITLSLFKETNMQHRSIRILLVLAAVLLAASVAMAQMAGPFSADVRSTSPHQGTSTGKMYVSTPKVRMELNMAGRTSIMIMDVAAKVTYMLMPEQHMYMEMHTDQMAGARQQPTWKPYDASNPCANEAGMTCSKVWSGDGQWLHLRQMVVHRQEHQECVD